MHISPVFFLTFASPRAPLGRHCSGAVRGAAVRACAAPTEDEMNVARFGNTRWSFYLALDEGGRTLFSLDLQPDGVVRFSNGGVDGTWRTRSGFIVVKQPTFLFGNDLYYSGRIVEPTVTEKADPAELAVVRLRDGIVNTDESRKVVRIGTFSAHQVVATDEEGDDYEMGQD
ncbi:hypothetical protein T492DRAFT_1021937 [Pavlovales sp. CCMP2436]|nr:hypothetical protein T492DRAFT_1021937 [Pavlovales sp. CCMP2436]